MGDERSVAGRFLDALEATGTDVVFGLPGVHNLAFWREPPWTYRARIVNVRHEQTALYAADAYARASGRLGCALVTSGPGAANAAAAFGEAAASKSPVVLVASEVPRHLIEAGVRGALHQSADQSAMFGSLAKAVLTPRTADDAVVAFADAVSVALAPPQGPVYLDVPADVLGQPAPPVEHRAVPSPVWDDAALGRAADLVEAAETVAIWAGGGAVQAGAAGPLAALAARLGAPVFTTFAGRGLLPPDHPCNVVLPPHEPEIESLLARRDLLLVLGSDFDAMTTKNHSLALPATIVSVNVDPAKAAIPGRGVHTVLGDARWAAERLLERTRVRRASTASEIARVCGGVWQRLRGDPRTWDAAGFVSVVQRVAAGRAVVVNDMAVAGYWLGGYYVPTRPRAMQYPVGWGTLGYALPASVGAAAGSGGPVLAVCGDGGIAFALAELATLVQEALPVTVLVLDDGGYGMLRFDQRHDPGPPRGTDLVTPDFVALGAAFGIDAVSVEGVGDDLDEALDDALESGRPRLVRCGAALYPPKSTSPRWAEP